MDAAAGERLDGLDDVAGHVEGPVAGDGQAAGRLHEGAHARLVDGSVRIETADHHPGDTEGPERADVVHHRVEFHVGVEEVAATGPNDHVEGHGGKPGRHLDHAPARGESPFQQRGTELHPVRASPLGGEKAVGVLDADLDGDRSHAPSACPVSAAPSARSPSESVHRERPQRAPTGCRPSWLPRNGRVCLSPEEAVDLAADCTWHGAPALEGPCDRPWVQSGSGSTGPVDDGAYTSTRTRLAWSPCRPCGESDTIVSVAGHLAGGDKARTIGEPARA